MILKEVNLLNLDYLKNHKNASFESARLLYCGITLDDAPKIVKWRSNSQIYRYFIHHSAVTMEGHLTWFQKYLTDETRFDYMITEKETDQKIGIVGLQNLHGTTGDISYFINVQSQGKGFGSEAIKTMSTYAFEDFKLQGLSAVILAENLASIKAAKYAGYQLYSQTYRLNRPENVL